MRGAAAHATEAAGSLAAANIAVHDHVLQVFGLAAAEVATRRDEDRGSGQHPWRLQLLEAAAHE